MDATLELAAAVDAIADEVAERQLNVLKAGREYMARTGIPATMAIAAIARRTGEDEEFVTETLLYPSFF